MFPEGITTFAAAAAVQFVRLISRLECLSKTPPGSVWVRLGPVGGVSPNWEKKSVFKTACFNLVLFVLFLIVA